MSENNKIYIDSQINNTLRSYKEFDNILYTIGIDNLILGLIKISSISSEKEESNFTIDDSYLKKIKDIIPIGTYLNGAIAIYNENTFEDFETVLNEQIEKVKNINKELLIAKSEDEINYIQLALKELLYLDDEDDFNFEFKIYGEQAEDDVEIIFCDNIIKKYFSGDESKYKFIVHNVQILFNNQKDINEYENIIELKKEQIKENNYLNNIFDISKNKGVILKLKQQDLIIDENFDDPQNFNDIKINDYNKTNNNINKLYYANVQLGVKKNNDEEQIIENIKLDIDTKDDLKTNLYIETIGLMSSENKNNEKLLISMLSQLKNYIYSLFTEDNKNIKQQVILYNELYSSLPFTLSALTPISFSDNNSISIINTKENKTSIENYLKLTKIFNINGSSFYDFSPIFNEKEAEDATKQNKYEHLLNPHLNISNILESPSNSHIIRGLIRGDYHYYHYNQDNFNDAGWGCAYRSLQTLLSWFLLNTSVGKNIKIPTIPEIQTILVKIGDKDKKIIGSNDWIGAIEVNLVLNELLGIDNQILYVPSGSELIRKEENYYIIFNIMVLQLW